MNMCEEHEVLRCGWESPTPAPVIWPLSVFGCAVISKLAQGCGWRGLYPFCHHRAGHTAMGNNKGLASWFWHTTTLQGNTQDFFVSGPCRALMSLVSIDIYFYLSPPVQLSSGSAPCVGLVIPLAGHTGLCTRFPLCGTLVWALFPNGWSSPFSGWTPGAFPEWSCCGDYKADTSSPPASLSGPKPFKQ